MGLHKGETSWKTLQVKTLHIANGMLGGKSADVGVGMVSGAVVKMLIPFELSV